MGTNRGHVIHRNEAKAFFTQSNSGSWRIGIPMPSSLRTISHRANCKRSSGTCKHSEFHYKKETLWLAYWDLIYGHVSSPLFCPNGKIPSLSSKAVRYTNVLEGVVQTKGKNVSADTIYGKVRDPWGIAFQPLIVA